MGDVVAAHASLEAASSLRILARGASPTLRSGETRAYSEPQKLNRDLNTGSPIASTLLPLPAPFLPQVEKLRLAARMLPRDEATQRAAKYVEQAMQVRERESGWVGGGGG